MMALGLCDACGDEYGTNVIERHGGADTLVVCDGCYKSGGE